MEIFQYVVFNLPVLAPGFNYFRRDELLWCDDDFDLVIRTVLIFDSLFLLYISIFIEKSN